MSEYEYLDGKIRMDIKGLKKGKWYIYFAKHYPKVLTRNHESYFIDKQDELNKISKEKRLIEIVVVKESD